MAEPLNVLISSSLKDQAYRIRSFLDRERNYRCSVKVLGDNGHADALQGLSEMPDVLILILGPAWESELDNVGGTAGSLRPPMIVIAQDGNMGQMRRAMQAGAKDFLGLSVDAEELQGCLKRIAVDLRTRPIIAKASGMAASVTAVINSKGGSGASFVACNLAYAIAKSQTHKTALIDLDLQFGVQDLCLDLKPKTGLTDAIARAEQLDDVALDGCAGQHESGLRLLGEYGDTLPLPWEVPRTQLGRLLKVAAGTYGQVVIDLPRQIDPLTSTALDAATTVCVVTNQSLIHLRDTKRMLRILTGELAIPRSRIKVVINRYLPDAAVGIKDIEEAVGTIELIQIPNDYKRASESMNLGMPVMIKHPGAAISRGFAGMAATLTGVGKPKAAGIRSAFAGLFGQAGDR